MNKLKRKHTILFILIDYLCSASAWFAFFLYRKYAIDVEVNGYKLPVAPDENLYLGLIIVPLYWLILYFIAGNYTDVWRRSRIREVANAFVLSLCGVIVLFFILLLDDKVTSYKDYYYTIIVLFVIHYGLLVSVRIVTATYIKSLIRKGIAGFNTIIVGNNQKTQNLLKEIRAEKIAQGYVIKGYVTAKDDDNSALPQEIKYLGVYEDLPELIIRHEIEEVIIGIESTKHLEIIKVNNLIEGMKVNMKIIPDIYDMMSGSVKMNNVMGAALIEINHQVLPQWQKVVKRMLDIGVSFVVLLTLIPVFLVIAILVKTSSKGTVFFKQIRVGLHGKPFYIFKFRTMVVNAEEEGPALAKKNDSRITPIGRLLRKYRLDELPQFYNVLIGDMSLVGPRPERKYFIDQIVQVAPHYKQLHRVRPGITSWGQVKYGYAENVEQMVERLKFDILYIENMSLAVDFRIMIYTAKTIIQGRGK